MDTTCFKKWTVLSTAFVALVMVLPRTAASFEISTGNKDVHLRWDNTFRYNFGYRVDKQDEAILKNVNVDDGDRNFDRGTITNRLDIFSELDLSFKNRYGFRVSGAAWYDQRYDDSLDNTSLATSNHIENGAPSFGLSDKTEEYFRGPSGEILDAFAFLRVDIAQVPVNLKIGRHTVYWGESLFLSGNTHGISYSQMPVDLIKGFAVPGSEAKEMFRPLANVSGQAQITDTLSLAAQYFFEWENYRLPESGSYFGFSDAGVEGGESLIAGPIRYYHGKDNEPDGTGDFGVGLRWSPVFLDGTLGFYYRKFSDKLFQTYLDVANSEYFFSYADDIDLYGISLSKNIWGISMGAELSYRENMPLVSDAIVLLPGTPRPAEGDTYGARGKTVHGVLNLLKVFNPSFCDSTTVGLELAWSKVESVDQGEQYYKGREGYTGIDGVTRDAWAGTMLISPTWFQVFPGWDLSLPIVYSQGISGNSGVMLGGNEGGGSYSAGISLDAYSKYRFDLKYIDYFGDYTTGPTGAVTVANGPFALIKDRGWISFTFKVTY